MEDVLRFGCAGMAEWKCAGLEITIADRGLDV